MVMLNDYISVYVLSDECFFIIVIVIGNSWIL